MQQFRIVLVVGLFLILPVVGGLFDCSSVWADVPKLINFQGRLTDSGGNPVQDSTYSILFTIYDALSGGTNLWSETQSVATKGGTFNVNLGSSTALPDNIFADTTRYLAVKVGTDPEMTPRQRIVSTAYVYQVRTVDGANGGTISGDVDIQSDLTVSGNVGIGTTTPSSKLEVEDPTTSDIRIDVGDAGGTGFLRFSKLGSQKFAIQMAGDDKTHFFAGLNEKLTLDASGNLGIGTTSPAAGVKLDVNGAIKGSTFTNGANPIITGNMILQPAAGAGLFVVPTTNSTQFFQVQDNLGQALLNVDAVNGNVGIGTTTPSERLHVADPISPGIRIDAGPGSTSGFLRFSKSGAQKFAIQMAGDDKTHFFAGVNEKLTLDASGKLGIGTTSPANILTVVQNSATDPIADAWTTYSSAEYKEGIRELSDYEYAEALSKLLETPVVKFRYKGQTEQDKEKIGIVIEEAPAEIVSEGNPKAASLSEYISLLHAALKAQQAKIEVLEEEMKILRERQTEVR